MSISLPSFNTACVQMSNMVAPAGVMIDLTSATSGATTLPFIEVWYKIDWGDTGSSGSGNWQYSNEPKNLSFGGVAHHVYRDPGTYTINVYAEDMSGATAVLSGSVTVLNPDTEFATTNTICFSTSGTFTGAPSGSDNRTPGTTGEIRSALAAGKRVLLRGGESWSGAWATLGVTTGSKAILGKFGASSTKPILTSSSNQAFFDFQAGALGWRVMDMDLRCSSTVSSDWCFHVQSGATHASEIVMLDCDVHSGLGVLITNGGTGGTSNMPDRIYAVGLKAVDTALANGFYFMGQRSTIQDCKIDPVDTPGEHCCRCWNIQKTSISNNWLKNPYFLLDASLNFAIAKHSIKIHGYDLTDAGSSKYIVVSANRARGSQRVFDIGVQGGTIINELVQQIVVERNLLEAIPDGVAGGDGLQFEGVDTVRCSSNVRLVPVGCTHYFGGFKTGPAGLPMRRARFLNNLMYGNGQASGHDGIEIDATLDDVVCRNNLLELKNFTGGSNHYVVFDHGATNFINSNNAESINTTPNLVDPDNGNYRTVSGSPQRDAGSNAVATFGDYYLLKRQGTAWNVGAAEFDTGAGDWLSEGGGGGGGTTAPVFITDGHPHGRKFHPAHTW